MNSSHENCKSVVFSNKAYNAIVNETFRKDPVETGGILLGHVLSNGYWIVMEVIPPGLKAIHQMAYFEYDTEFVNYMANSVSKQYKMELDVLGLWHRHPGSMDFFSGTDDGTNKTFAQMNPYGAISGLVNIDPKFRFTLRHVAYPLDYQIVEVEVGDDLIPDQYFELKYAYGGDLRPFLPGNTNSGNNTIIREPERQSGNNNPNPEGNTNNGQVAGGTEPKHESGKTDGNDDGKSHIFNGQLGKGSFRKYMPIGIVAVVCLLIGVVLGGGTCSRHDENESSTQQVSASSTDQNSNPAPATNPKTSAVSKPGEQPSSGEGEMGRAGQNTDAGSIPPTSDTSLQKNDTTPNPN